MFEYRNKDTKSRCVMLSLHFADLGCIWFNEGVQCGSIQSLQTGHVVSRGVLHPGQWGGREHLCLERCEHSFPRCHRHCLITMLKHM